MKVTESHPASYRPVTSRQATAFEPATSGFPGRQRDGGTFPDASAAPSSPVRLSAAFWTLNAEQLEKRAAVVKQMEQKAAGKAAADTAATRQAFMDWSGKSVAEKVRAQFLQARDLTEDAVTQMDPAARQAFDKEISKAILRQAGVETDRSVGLTTRGSSRET